MKKKNIFTESIKERESWKREKWEKNMFCTYKNNFLYIIHYYIIMLLLLYYLHTKDIIRSILYCHQRNNKNKHLWEKNILSYILHILHTYIYIYNIVDTIYIIIIVRLPRYNITLNNYVCKWYRYLFSHHLVLAFMSLSYNI